MWQHKAQSSACRLATTTVGLTTEVDGAETELSTLAGRRSRRRAFATRRRRSNFTTTMSTMSTVAAVAAVATMMAAVAAVTTAVAPMAAAAVTVGVTVMATATVTIAIAGATTAVAGNCCVVTTHQGDANHREKDRDAQNQCTIHPRILQKNEQVPYRKQFRSRWPPTVRCASPAWRPSGRRTNLTSPCNAIIPLPRVLALFGSLCGLHRITSTAQARSLS